MNCDAKQGCFFKKSVCNSGCKSKLPVEIAKVSTARLTFSSPLARLAEAFPPFLSFFPIFAEAAAVFPDQTAGGHFSIEIIVPKSSNLSMIYKMEPSIFVPSHRTRVQRYVKILQIFQPTTNWLTTALHCNHNWLKYLKVVDISIYCCKIVW
jgi:hypothetical protein